MAGGGRRGGERRGEGGRRGEAGVEREGGKGGPRDLGTGVKEMAKEEAGGISRQTKEK